MVVIIHIGKDGSIMAIPTLPNEIAPSFNVYTVNSKKILTFCYIYQQQEEYMDL
jgi:hypothetical protein